MEKQNNAFSEIYFPIISVLIPEKWSGYLRFRLTKNLLILAAKILILPSRRIFDLTWTETILWLSALTQNTAASL